MSRILAISDIHLKPEIFDRADKVLESGQADRAIQLGDLVDDWGREFNIELYVQTLLRAIQFQKDHPDTLWVMGNHDYGYWAPSAGMTESGHSRVAESEVYALLKELEKQGGEQKIMHLVDNCLFSHAGVTKEWVLSLLPEGSSWEDDEEYVYNLVNDSNQSDLWQENSPLWARPQYTLYEMWGDKFQIVGHTPLATIMEKNNVLSTDAFSTLRGGSPIGIQRFVIVDTESTDWRLAEEGI